MPERISYTPRGLITDLPDKHLQGQVWNTVKNMVFRKGFAELAGKGHVVFDETNTVFAVDPVPAAPVWLQSSITFDDNFWVYATDDNTTQKFYATDGVTHQEITPAGGATWEQFENAITGGVLSGLPVVNWGTDSGYWRRDFATPGVMTLLPGAPECRAMRSHNNRLIAINTVDNTIPGIPDTEETLAWSSLPQDPTTPPLDMPAAEDWIPAIENSAGFVTLSGGGPLIDAASLRSSLVVASDSRLWIMDETNSSFVFNVRKVSSTTGVLSRNCMASIPEGLVILSGDDVTVFDGTNQRSIVDNEIKIELFKQLGDNFAQAFVINNAARAEVLICIPTGSEKYATQAFVWDTGTHKWGHRQLPHTPAAGVGPIPFPGAFPTAWDDQTEIWDDVDRIWNQAVNDSQIASVILADAGADGSGVHDINTHRFVSMDLGVPGAVSANLYPVGQASCSVQNIDLGDADKLKTIVGLWAWVTGETDTGSARNRITISVGRKNSYSAEQRPPLNKEFRVTIENRTELIQTSRFFDITFTEEASTGAYTIEGFDLEYETRGKF